jgi:hypothetical protein
MEIIRTSGYAAALKRLKKLGASPDDIIAMENAIARAPETGVVFRGTNGLRKFALDTAVVARVVLDGRSIM